MECIVSVASEKQKQDRSKKLTIYLELSVKSLVKFTRFAFAYTEDVPVQSTKHDLASIKYK